MPFASRAPRCANQTASLRLQSCVAFAITAAMVLTAVTSAVAASPVTGATRFPPPSTLEISSPATGLTPPHADMGIDTDGDGQFNFLAVDAHLSIDQAGTYRISALLHDPSCCPFHLVTFASNQSFLDAGAQTMQLTFDGAQLNASGVDGPYLVDMALYEPPSDTPLDNNKHTTAAYSHLDFESLPIAFAPPHADRGVDTDGDGQFDRLVIDVNVSIDLPGSYTVTGSLRNASGALDLFKANNSNLNVGRHTMQLSYDGSIINASGADGPYNVSLDAYAGYYSKLWASSAYATSAYRHFDFETPYAVFAPPFSDTGLDTDGDGLFNVLAVDVPVTVNVASLYTVGGNLHKGPYSVIVSDHDTRNIDVGNVTVRLEFSGPQINFFGVDGPYIVDLFLIGPVLDFDLDDARYMTAAYNHTDFEPPPVLFAAPHADAGADSDGDGRYDALVVAVGLSIDAPGWYSITANLYFESRPGSRYAANSSYLDVGFASLNLTFIGAQLNNSGADGPYIVDMAAWDPSFWQPWDTDRHTTAAYRHIDFEEVPTIRSSHATPVPTIDGVFSTGEWDDAFAVNLSSVPANGLSGSLRMQDDNQILYMAYDATGDLTEDANDAGAVSFDTADDALFASSGHEDQFVLGGAVPSGRAHYVFDAGSSSWQLEDAPFNENLPNHEGLAGARGFGSTEELGTAHRIYEFSIPLSLLHVAPGDRIGVWAGSYQTPSCAGVIDALASAWSGWPSAGGCTSPFGFGDLVFSNDTNLPSLEILSPADGALIPTDTVIANWTASDIGLGLDRFELRLDGGDPVVLSPSVLGYTFSGLTDGAHAISLTAVDRAGNRATKGVTITVDATPPTLAISFPGSGSHLATSDVEVTWSAADALSGIDRFEIGVDGGPPSVLPADARSSLLSNLSEGAHQVDVAAFDLGGLSTMASTNFTVDTVPPAVDLLSPEPGALGSSSIQVSWEAIDLGDALDHFELRVDSDPPIVLSPNETNYTLTDVPDGSHTISITAVDLAGNTAADTVAVIVDTVLPEVSITAPTPGAYLATPDVVVSWGAADATTSIDHYEVRLDASTPTVLPGSESKYTFLSVPDGLHAFAVTAFDDAGNVRTVSVSVVVDATRPVVSITAPVEGRLLGVADVEVRWLAADATSGIDRFEIRLDGGGPTSLPRTDSSYAFSNLGDGSHTISLTAYDVAGNAATAAVTVVVDTTPPTLRIVLPFPGELSSSPHVPVVWTVSDAASGMDRIEIRLDGGELISLPAGTTVYVFTDLPDGSHTFTVTAFDRVGNVARASVDAVVDTTAPMVSIVTPASDALVASSDVTIMWTAGDATSGIDHFDVSVDGGSPEHLPAGTTGHTFVGLADGPHAFTVVAFDRVWYADVASVNATVDATAPSLDLTSPDAGAIATSSSVAVVWNASDATSGLDRIVVSLDGGSPQTLPPDGTEFLLSGLADGIHTVTVRAFDTAGNVATASASFRVDTGLFSPTGPYGYVGIVGLLLAIAALVSTAVIILWTGRRKPPPGESW